ncbi:phosphonate C-P lyase system protein PhnL [Okeania sp. KiyG1]|uniref:phosphonate C-P lyase system protein PhnL n=1 Tax=Okeania sp. KiyG1 TaxID=2720165 RepID=UPI0019246F5E|nr:phosphonate C-P lyase system protein PhnL [Okeania sp. KiyG1]GGA45584.1 phosphonate C-P lyase system protein PhnL [Okeania sp. KiyG1]
MTIQLLTANNQPENTFLESSLLLKAEALEKSFTLHNQGGVKLSVLKNLSLSLTPGECIALSGKSGSGKSTFMRCLYGNYRVDKGSVFIKHKSTWVDIPKLAPHQILEVRKNTIGYVSQFLRVIPRVPALEVAAEPLLELGIEPKVAYQKVAELFEILNLPKRLWHLSPTTFSGGEKQRVNLARSLTVDYPILLLDEPTSALDSVNRQVVIELLEKRLVNGCGLIGIFHDEEVKRRLCTREILFGI